ncbi:hypothetical protein BD779DRAFT_1790174 [Infundibulicybe gibba]|nr:hypothetical protein BD779DRAFT_1790174 [Infundibulicybe gibba]
MTPKFPAPLLSVTPDAVRHLEGDDALSRLWTLFTKCKESLQEGRRLENISWRLWYRELHRDEAHGNSAFDAGWNEKHLPLNDEKLYRPPTPDESLHLSPILPAVSPTTAAVGMFQAPDSLTTSSMTSLPSPTHLRPRRNSSIGQIICDMLPSLSISPTSMATAIIPQAEITFAQPITRRCHLPTPDEHPSSPPLLQEPIPVPTIDLPDPDPPNTHLDPPRLVINQPPPPPTPNGRNWLEQDTDTEGTKHTPPPVSVGPPSPQLERPIVDLTSPPVRAVNLDDDPGGSVAEDTRLSGGRLLGSISEVQTKQDASAGQEASPSPTASSFSQSPTTHDSAQSPTKSTSQAQKKVTVTGRLMRSISSGSGRAAGGKKTRAATSRSLSRTRSSGSKAGEEEDAAAVKEAPGKRDEVSKAKASAVGAIKKLAGVGSGKRPVAVGRTLHAGAVRKGVGGAAKERERSKERNQVEVEVITDVIRSERNAGKTGAKGKGSEPVDKSKRPRFNIGSHSDGGGSGSKSAGSASSGSALETGANLPAAPLVPTKPGIHPSVHPNQATQIQPSHPALPQRRTTIVIATSDSDYETETETDEEGEDGGEWSEESASEPVVAPPPTTRPQHQHQPPARHPPQHTANHQHPPRHPQRQTVPEIPIEQAVLEAQRRRELFTKKPTSATSLGGVGERTRSVGLLTQLMNPDPEIFPIGHPYRRGFSSGEIRGPRPPSGTSKPPAQNTNVAPPAARVPANGNALAQPQPQTKPTQPSQGRPYKPGGLQVRKSSAAVPLASQIQIGSANGYTSNIVPTVPHNSGGYRPKGRPDDQEMEDDSDSEDDAGDPSKNGGIVGRFTNSVAEERLKALVQLKGKGARMVSGPNNSNSKPNSRLGDEDDHEVPVWARQERPQPTTSNAPRYAQQHKPTPIPLGHPYNLPPPAAPSTPRTTRRLMLQTEMSESLRRNLLWERQVSKVNLVGFRRAIGGEQAANADGTDSRNRPNGAGDPQRRRSVLGNETGALPAAPSMVQLTAKTGDGEEREQDRERRGPVNKGPTDELKRQAMARNRSWADDYHTRGW